MNVIDGGTTSSYYYHTNQIGSTTAITNSTGNIVERVKYDDYGLPTFCAADGTPLAQNQSTIGNNILFQGREYEPELNLYYYRARYYDPQMGRFLQTDPIGYKDSMNLYQAMNQNAVNFIDSFGLMISLSKIQSRSLKRVTNNALNIMQMTSVGKTAYDALNSDKSRTFYIVDTDNNTLGGAKFELDTVTPDNNNFTDANIFINLKNLKYLIDPSFPDRNRLIVGEPIEDKYYKFAEKMDLKDEADLLKSFKRFKGLKSWSHVVAEVLVHEFSHAMEAQIDPELAVKRKQVFDQYSQAKLNFTKTGTPIPSKLFSDFNYLYENGVMTEEVKIAYMREIQFVDELIRIISEKKR